ncbi:hypothetical protein SDC9_99291 [bioreactor metagenome]|uniref:Uncharacterized protein n=1 Tax=bioreactor metagenome TaxID=1076179 RepID=A0A645AJR2_9ZZZZ
MLVELLHVAIKAFNLLFLRGEHAGKLFGKALHIRKEAHALPFVIDHIQQLVFQHVDGFLQAVHYEPVRVKAMLAKAVEHGRALVKGGFPAPEDAAGAAGLLALVHDGNAEPSFGEQARSC